MRKPETEAVVLPYVARSLIDEQAVKLMELRTELRATKHYLEECQRIVAAYRVVLEDMQTAGARRDAKARTDTTEDYSK